MSFISKRFTRRTTWAISKFTRCVALARALVNNPSIILADEPTGALDTRTSVEVMELFQRLNRERSLTIVVVTHEPDIAQYAKRIIQFRDGRIHRDIPVENRKDA